MSKVRCGLKDWMRLTAKRKTLSSERVLICPFLDTVLCEGQKILVVFWRISTEAGLMVEFVIRVNQQRTSAYPRIFRKPEKEAQ
jgi:hypothetical protein